MNPLARRNSLDPETGTPLHWAVKKIVLVAAEEDLLVTRSSTTGRSTDRVKVSFYCLTGFDFKYREV